VYNVFIKELPPASKFNSMAGKQRSVFEIEGTEGDKQVTFDKKRGVTCELCVSDVVEGGVVLFCLQWRNVLCCVQQCAGTSPPSQLNEQSVGKVCTNQHPVGTAS
jgi:hypothetical protein